MHLKALKKTLPPIKFCIFSKEAFEPNACKSFALLLEKAQKVVKFVNFGTQFLIELKAITKSKINLKSLYLIFQFVYFIKLMLESDFDSSKIQKINQQKSYSLENFKINKQTKFLNSNNS